MITSDEILGTEAIDSEGDFLGIVMKLHLDPVHKTILGISIDPGLWKPDLYIGIDFVKQFGVDAIFLSTIPDSKYKSIPVFTYEGKKIGSILNISIGKNKLREIKIQINPTWRNFFRSRQTFSLTDSSIHELGHSLVLKKNFQIPDSK